MKILWLSNIPIPEASTLMNIPSVPFGGWLVGGANALANSDCVSLAFAFPLKGIKNVENKNGDKINYFAFPYVRENKSIKSHGDIHIRCLKQIVEDFAPDLVQIFGTECAHSLAMAKICKEQNIPAVISIQGLLSIYAEHYMTGIPFSTQINYTLRELLPRQTNLWGGRRKFIIKGAVEQEAIKTVDHIIGRTAWDEACSLQINPNAHYHFCNETLRKTFYTARWRLENCERHTIFLSQVSYPIKGLQFVLEALPIILQRFPDTRVFISGPDITGGASLLKRLLKSSFGKFITTKIKKFNLDEKIIFCGVLSETEMCERLAKTHVFVSPSTVENESNSLSEAKILGVPCVASYAGGVTSRIQHGIDGFHYQHDAPYMLAYYVCKIFENNSLALTISQEARKNALETNDPTKNLDTLVSIYTNILKNKLSV